jgi:hypothetical protein
MNRCEIHTVPAQREFERMEDRRAMREKRETRGRERERGGRGEGERKRGMLRARGCGQGLTTI